jgi:ElaB/YqjD/DUF883 family membrane-anchored ribosome-binding protein
MTTSKETSTDKSKTKNVKGSNSSSSTPIVDSVTETLHQSVDALSGHATNAEVKIRETATTSSETMTEKQLQAQQYWNKSTVGKYTKENPVATAGLAFVAGVVLTTLLNRK